LKRSLFTGIGTLLLLLLWFWYHLSHRKLFFVIGIRII
jgi:hypothetical protein